MAEFRIVAAVDPLTGGMGFEGRMAWSVPPDLVRFRRLTEGGVVIMGRRTWESLPGPLPGRTCVVLSRADAAAGFGDGANVVAAHSLDDALAYARDVLPDASVWVIGGQEVFEAAVEHPACVGAEITEIWCAESIPFDRVFPARNLWIRFTCITRSDFHSHGKYSYRFVSYGSA